MSTDNGIYINTLGDWEVIFDNEFTMNNACSITYPDAEKIKDFIRLLLHQERNDLRRWMKGKQVTKEKIRVWLNERENL